MSGITLPFWLLIETHFDRVAFSGTTLDKIVNPVKNVFLIINENTFISYYSFSLNTYECLKDHQL